MKKRKEKLARLQVLMTLKEKEALKRLAFKKRTTMSKILMDSYRKNEMAEAYA